MSAYTMVHTLREDVQADVNNEPHEQRGVGDNTGGGGGSAGGGVVQGLRGEGGYGF